MAGGGNRIGRVDLTETLIIEFNSADVRQFHRIGRRIQPDRQHHQIELLFLDPLSKGRVANGDIVVFGNFTANGDIAADETHVVEFFGALVEALEIFTIGTNIVMEDGGSEIGVMIFREDHLLLGIGAADRRTV